MDADTRGHRYDTKKEKRYDPDNHIGKDRRVKTTTDDQNGKHYSSGHEKIPALVDRQLPDRGSHPGERRRPAYRTVHLGKGELMMRDLEKITVSIYRSDYRILIAIAKKEDLRDLKNHPSIKKVIRFILHNQKVSQ